MNIEIISEINETAYYKGFSYKYKTYVYNNKINYQKIKHFYETNSHLGLDDVGNISVDNNLYMPILQGNFKYYPNKSNNDKSEILLNTINVIFI